MRAEEIRTEGRPLRTGAVILAAGMSSRMGEFKQLMRIGDLTMAEHVVSRFQHAGIRDIVMVTGFRAGELEKALSGREITFLRNPDYADTEMFDSVKIGISYLQDICDRVFLCPVDIPLFTEKTVEAELAAKGEIVIPVSNGRKGHPILIGSALIPEILAYRGKNGLRGALDSLHRPYTYLYAEDEGSLLDADTRQDFEQLVRRYEKWEQDGNTSG